MIELPETITAAWINNLDDAARIDLAKGQFGKRLHHWAGKHVAYFWWIRKSPLGPTIVNNGSVFFLGLGERLFAVTAAHVYEGYLREKVISRGQIVCQIGNLRFDPEARLHGYREGIDIVTFDLTYEELSQIGKQAMILDAASWPPPHPASQQAALLAGFPGVSRLWTSWDSVSFGLYTALTPVNASSDRQITCPFNRSYWVDTIGNGLPPEGMKLGGLSGGPLLLPMEQDGSWSWQLGGVISEARTDGYETVVSVPAHFIAFDGTINNELSAPVRQAILTKAT